MKLLQQIAIMLIKQDFKNRLSPIQVGLACYSLALEDLERL